MRKAVAGFAVVALLLVVAGCPGGPKVKDLEAQVSALQQHITELDGQVETLTMERDSLQGVVDKLSPADGSGGSSSKPPRQGSGGSLGGGSGTPGKPPRTGR